MRYKQGDQPTTLPLGNNQAIEKIGSDIEVLQAHLNTVNIVLKKHDDDLVEYRRLICQHSERFERLEEKVNAVQVMPSIKHPPALGRLIDIPGPSTAPVQATSYTPQKFDINRFSEQQKRILAVFFQNEGMALSYVDVGRILNKSPHTVKNQMREIGLKADLFDRTLGEKSRHRFKLKKDLRIEKYLNVG